MVCDPVTIRDRRVPTMFSYANCTDAIWHYHELFWVIWTKYRVIKKGRPQGFVGQSHFAAVTFRWCVEAMRGNGFEMFSIFFDDLVFRTTFSMFWQAKQCKLHSSTTTTQRSSLNLTTFYNSNIFRTITQHQF